MILNNTVSFLNWQVLNPLDAICNQPREDAICVSQLKNAHPIDEGLLQERPDVKIFLPFRFLFYRPEEVFQPNTYNRYLGKFWICDNLLNVNNGQISIGSSCTWYMISLEFLYEVG